MADTRSRAARRARPPPLTLRFVGRRRELAQLGAALDAAAAGRGAVVLLSGDAGIGKTRTLEELERHALERGFCVHWGRCHDAAGAPPYWPWLQTLRSHCEHRDVSALREALGAHADVLAGLVAPLRRSERSAPPPALVGQEARFRMMASITAFLRCAAAGQPWLVILDDLQWADPSTLQLLGFALRELRSERVLIAATLRDTEIRHGSEAARVLQSLRADRLALTGLSEPDARRLLVQLVGRRAPAHWVRSLVTATGGNPFFLDRLARALSAERGAGLDEFAAPALPEEVRQLIVGQLDRLGDATRLTLSVGAALGHEFETSTLARVLALRPDVVSEQLEEASAARLTQECVAGIRHRFAHALIRDAAHGLLPALERARWHARIAGELEARQAAERDVALSRLAHHFHEAAPLIGIAKAVSYQRQAAAAASAVHAYEEAVRRLELAQELLASGGGAEEERLDVRLSLGDARRSAGDVQGARRDHRQAAGVARRLGDARRLARAANGFAGFWATIGTVDAELEGLLCEAVERLADQEPAQRSRLLARLALERTLGGDPSMDARRDPAEEALALALRVGQPAEVALARYAWILASDGEPPGGRSAWWDETVRLAEAGGDVELALAAHGWKAAERLAASDLDGFDACVAAYARLGQRVGHWTHVMSELTWRIARCVLAGRFAEAEQALEEMRTRFGTSESVAYGAAGLVLMRWHQGRLREVLALLRGLAAALPGLRVLPFWHAWAEAELDEPGAAASFATLAARDFDDVRHDPFRPAALTVAAATCARLGERTAAATLYEVLLPLAGRRVVNPGLTADLGAADRSLGLLAAVRGRWHDSVSHFEAAIRSDERVGAAPARAWNESELARALRRRAAPGDAERAAQLVARARAEALRLGMAGLLARIEAPGGAGGRPRVEPLAEARLQRADGHWELVCDGVVTHLEDLQGLHYLRALLRRAGELVAARALVELAEDDAAPAERLHERASLAADDGDEAAAEERARLNVTRALRLAIRKIGAAEPRLRRDLEASLKTGRLCRYDPDPHRPVRWIV